MHRRRVLAGAAGGLALFGGCLSRGGPAGAFQLTTPKPRAGPYDEIEPTARATVGDPSALDGPATPHSILVWNNAPNQRSIAVRLIGPSGDEPVFQERYNIAPNDYVEWSVALVGYFDVEVAIGGNKFMSANIESSMAFVDCNDSSTYIRVGEDGGLYSETTSTAMACPDEVANRTERTASTAITTSNS